MSRVRHLLRTRPGVRLLRVDLKRRWHEGRIRGPRWTACTLGVHLSPGILTPGIPGSLTLSLGLGRLQPSRGAWFLPLLRLRRPLVAAGSNSTYPSDDAMSWRASTSLGRGPGTADLASSATSTSHHLHMLRPLKKAVKLEIVYLISQIRPNQHHHIAYQFDSEDDLV